MDINHITNFERYNFGKFPTPIVKNELLSKELEVNLLLKLEYQADAEGSGNKVRKLEYIFQDIKQKNANIIIADGSIHSNCCLAISNYARKLGIKTRFLFIGKKELYGNHLKILINGSQGNYLSEWSLEGVTNGIDKIMTEEKKKGNIPYYIPTGATNEIGLLGSIDLGMEVCNQHKEYGFDYVLYPSGTGGTQAGITIAHHFSNSKWENIPIGIANSNDILKKYCMNFSKEFANKYNINDEFLKDINFSCYMKALGEGYGISSDTDIKEILRIYRETGIYFDSTYNYKVLKAINLLKHEGVIRKNDNVLLIHTGGINESNGIPISKINQFSRFLEVENE